MPVDWPIALGGGILFMSHGVMGSVDVFLQLSRAEKTILL